jgi:hypothetical protein
MPFWSRLFGHQPAADSKRECLMVCLKVSNAQFGTHEERDSVHRFTDKLASIIEQNGVGEFDGDEFGGGEGRLFIYGPSADELFDVIAPMLRSWEPLNGGHVIKRYGRPAESERIDF